MSFGSRFSFILVLICADDFPLKIPFKSASKSSFFGLGVEIRFWSVALVRTSNVFCNPVFTDRSGLPNGLTHLHMGDGYNWSLQHRFAGGIAALGTGIFV